MHVFVEISLSTSRSLKGSNTHKYYYIEQHTHKHVQSYTCTEPVQTIDQHKVTRTPVKRRQKKQTDRQREAHFC